MTCRTYVGNSCSDKITPVGQIGEWRKSGIEDDIDLLGTYMMRSSAAKKDAIC